MATYRVVWEKLGRGINVQRNGWGAPSMAQVFEDINHPDELAHQLYIEIRTAKLLASREVTVVVDLEVSEVTAYAGGRRVGWGTVTEIEAATGP